MMKTFFLGILLVVFIGCQNAGESPVPDTLQKNVAAPIIDTSPALTPHADSINKANAETIQMDGVYVEKALVSNTDSSILLIASMKLDHRIFGYEMPDIGSKKMILLSIFTDDVKDNPLGLPFGAYYQTSDMGGLSLKFVGKTGGFIAAAILKNNISQDTVFIEKKWIVFE